jgi:choline dehydrogenase-like flavoprotein
MIYDAKKMEVKDIISTNSVCIIGGGVAGIILALEISRRKLNVIVLESGTDVFDESTQVLYKAQSFPAIFPNPHYSRLRMLGGSSNHWENSTERFDPIDFEKRSWISNSGWPINYSDIEKYYPEAETYCGVNGGGYDLPSWLDQLKIEDLSESSKRLYTSIIKSAVPPTNFYRKYKNELARSRRIQVYKNANVTDIIFNESKNKVNGVVFQSDPGKKFSITAGQFILCAGGIENARLLLHFNKKYNDKLGNQYDNVGRYFMEHPVIRGAHFYPFSKTVPQIYSGYFHESKLVKARLKLNREQLESHKTYNLRTILVKQPYSTLSHGISSAHILKQGYIDENFGLHLSNILKDYDVIADAFSRKIADFPLIKNEDYEYDYQVLAMIEQTPYRNNRVYLGHKLDKFGLPKVKIDWTVTQIDRDMAWKSLELFAVDPAINKHGRVRLLYERDDRIWYDQLGFSQHHIGSTRMAENYSDGVVGADSKVYGTKNLFIAGSSVFPTGGHVPPTLTIAAMAIKLGNEIYIGE